MTGGGGVVGSGDGGTYGVLVGTVGCGPADVGTGVQLENLGGSVGFGFFVGVKVGVSVGRGVFVAVGKGVFVGGTGVSVRTGVWVGLM